MRFEIDSIELLRSRLDSDDGLSHTVIQGLDLREESARLLHSSFEGSVILGCKLNDEISTVIRTTGGVIFPRLRNIPYEAYRPTLYDAQSLTKGYRRGEPESLQESFDALVYAHYEVQRKLTHKTPVVEALAQRLHDHGIDDALADFLHKDGQSRKVVAVMGGHGMLRSDPAYRQVARIAHKISNANDELIMATGGGPGAMEATNLGAWLSRYPLEAIDEALAMMLSASSYKDPEWWETALAVLDTFSENSGESIGIPTWYYGHEPPNLFASHIAKYFSNSLREDGLLTIAEHGVIYAPGSAGTIQEIFMDACQNHYGSLGTISPMVFLDSEYWTKTKPVFPLLKDLARGRQYAEMLFLTDDEDELIDFVLSHPPVPANPV